MDKHLLKIEKRFLSSFSDDYNKIKEIMLPIDFLLKSYALKESDKEYLKKIKEPLPFIAYEAYAVFFDMNKLSTLKPTTIKVLKELYRTKRPSMYLFRYLESRGYHLNVSPLKMSLIGMNKGSQMGNAGLNLISGDYLKAQSFLTDEESDILKTKGVDIYFKLLMGESPRKIKIKEIKNTRIRFKDKKHRTLAKDLIEYIDGKTSYIFEGSEVTPKIMIENIDDTHFKLTAYYRSGKKKIVVNLKILCGSKTVYSKKGVGSKLYSIDGELINETYYKRNSYSSRVGFSFSDNSISIKNAFKKINPSYKNVMTESYQKDLLKLIVYSGDFAPQSIMNDIKKKWGLDYKEYKDDPDAFVESLKLFVKI